MCAYLLFCRGGAAYLTRNRGVCAYLLWSLPSVCAYLLLSLPSVCAYLLVCRVCAYLLVCRGSGAGGYFFASGKKKPNTKSLSE